MLRIIVSSPIKVISQMLPLAGELLDILAKKFTIYSSIENITFKFLKHI